MANDKYIPPCEKCGGKCCRYVAIEIDRPNTKSGIDHIRWYLLHENVNVFLDHWKKWHIEFHSPCECLDKNGRCSCYSERPKICRQHGCEEGDCEFFDSPYLEYFKSARDFEKYLKKKKIDWKFKNL